MKHRFSDSSTLDLYSTVYHAVSAPCAVLKNEPLYVCREMFLRGPGGGGWGVEGFHHLGIEPPLVALISSSPICDCPHFPRMQPITTNLLTNHTHCLPPLRIQDVTVTYSHSTCDQSHRGIMLVGTQDRSICPRHSSSTIFFATWSFSQSATLVTCS